MHALALEGLGTRLAEFTCNNEKLTHMFAVEVIPTPSSYLTSDLGTDSLTSAEPPVARTSQPPGHGQGWSVDP